MTTTPTSTPAIWYRDMDNDGYPDGTTQTACLRPAGFRTAAELASTAELDCNDGNPAVHPFATEICNGLDDDCDGKIREGTTGGLTYVGNLTFTTQAQVADAFSPVLFRHQWQPDHQWGGHHEPGPI
ncbi:MAG: putative metal-binding motif-containing protein [Saprospiraceae bacterium]